MVLTENIISWNADRILLWLLISFLFSCNNSEKQNILYINSYHEGYPPSDEAMRAIREAFPENEYRLYIRFLNAKRNPSPEWLRHAADSFAHEITAIKPGAVILADDDAVKYMRDFIIQNPTSMFVFCGVNWSADHYSLPRQNVTGMLEVLPLRQAIHELLKIYPESRKIAILSENSLSEQNNTLLLDTLYRNMGLTPEYHLVDDFETWKERFAILQNSADLIYLPTNGAIAGWDNDQAKAWEEGRIKKPVFTCDDFMMSYAVFGLTKIPREQGEWASLSVKKILGGVSPEDIPLTSNSQTKKWLNHTLADKTGFSPDPDWISSATIIQ